MALFSDRTIVSRARLRELREREKSWRDLQLLKSLPSDLRDGYLHYLDRSHSQIRQDLFALSMSRFRRDGFFVEFGATDGVELNNTWLMETEFGWRGILAEPARVWHDALHANRKAAIDTRCVWRASGETMTFVEAPRAVNSGIAKVVPTARKLRGTSYPVQSVSLNDLLEQHSAPAEIDYISVDTEGSELDILQAFDFDRWHVRVMTVEHGFQPHRADIRALMLDKGFRHVHAEISAFDDWYVQDGALPS